MNNLSGLNVESPLSQVAYLLVVHGSRSLFYRQQLNQLQQLILQEMDQSCFLTTAYLELDDRPLSTVIVDFSVKCRENGYKTLKIFPLFLSSGTHVLEDIPREVDIAQQNSAIKIELMTFLGKNISLINLLESKYQPYSQYDRILFSHGTTIDQGKEESQYLADQLKAENAYWSIYPHLTTVIKNKINLGCQDIVILPYFLFSGKIISSIEEEIKMIRENTKTNLILLSPLGATVELAKVITTILSC